MNFTALHKIKNINENPFFIRHAQTIPGKIILVMVFALFICNINTYPHTWQQVLFLTISAITFMPKYRYMWLFIGMLCLLFQSELLRPGLDWVQFRINYLFDVYEKGYQNLPSPGVIKYIDIMLALLISETLVFLTSRFHKFKFMQYPITVSYTFLLTLILVASYAPLAKVDRFILWSFISVYNHYFWFTGYTLLQGTISRQRNYLLDFGRYLPVWGFTEMPYGKGSIYLRQVEAKTSEEFAVTQLKAIKLCCWAFILYLALHLMYKLNAYFHIPKLMDARRDYANGIYYSPWRAWLCLWDTFFRRMLELTVMGHFFVSACRMCGFKILRNTYKPLQAPTVAEYWNRYNYYFKELLVAFFFYPTFFRYFKNMPKLRLFFATCSAATFGNILFHFLLLTPIMMTGGFRMACKGYIPFIFYAVVLGISIGFSQLRNMPGYTQKYKFKHYIMSPLLVLFFYSILGVFSNTFQNESIMVNIRFVASLFNITW